MAHMPVWREIYHSLKDDIASGKFRTGDRLPTESALSTAFGVNRHTVRRALAELSNENAIYVRRGSGAYVSAGIIDYPIGSRVKFSHSIAQLGRVPAHRLLDAGIVEAEGAILQHLGLKPGSAVVFLQTLGEADGLPINHVSQYLPAARFPGLAAAFAETMSLTKALVRFGITDYQRAWTRITARAPAKAVSAALQQFDNQPVLRTEGVNLDMAGEPIEYAVADWAAGRTQFVVEAG